MEVVAKRYKKLNIVVAVVLGIALAILCVLLFCVVEKIEVYYLLALILIFLIELFFIYLALLPRDAIVVKDGKLIIQGFFTKTEIPIKDVKYASVFDSKWHANNMDTAFAIAETLKEVRTVYVVYNLDGFEKRKAVLCVEYATSVETSINSLIKK